MNYDDVGPIVRVFVASPSDLVKEREAAVRGIQRADRRFAEQGLSFQILRWEDLGPDDRRPQERINEMVRLCTVFVAILWLSWGSETGQAESGFAEEWALAMRRWRESGKRTPRIWPFFKSVPTADLERPSADLKHILDLKESIEKGTNSSTRALTPSTSSRRSFTTD